MRPIATPSSISSADELLPTARQLLDDEAAFIETDPQVNLSCKAGCSACCSGAVPVHAAELRAIANHLAKLSPPRQRVFQDRITNAVADLAQAGIDEVAVPDVTRPENADFAQRYFGADVACPMLDDDGTCGIRPIRPLACREYLVISDPSHCATPGEVVVRIRSQRDILAGFAQVSDRLGEPDSVLLATALGHAIPQPPPQQSVAGGAMLRLLTSRRHS